MSDSGCMMETAEKMSLKERMNWKFPRVGGVVYPKFFHAPDVPKNLELIEQVKVRDDDVFMVGFPKSGNHWTYEILNMVIHQNTIFASECHYNALIDSFGESIDEILDKMALPRILCTHNKIYRLPSLAIDKKAKIVYLVRNPKDILCSLYRVLTNLSQEVHSFKGTWDDFFQMHISGDLLCGTWFDHVLATENFIKENPDCLVYIHVFEEVKKDPVGKIKDLCSFLGKPDILAEEIAVVTEFSNMKASLRNGKMKIMAQHVKSDDVLFKKGIVGDWKSHFTVAQSELFNHIFKEKMAGSRIGALVQ